MGSVIEPPASREEIGKFNSIAYVKYAGRFVGEAACGRFAVPYEITAPANPKEASGVCLFEPVKIPGQKPIIVFNTEGDFDARAVPRPDLPAYKFYEFAGAAHICDSVPGRVAFPDPPKPGSPAPAVAGTTPINWLPFARALFVAGDQWVRKGVQPPPSNTLKVDAQGNVMRDARGNALGGIRHPALDAGEATFMASVVRDGWTLFGGYGNPRRLQESEFPGYVESFTKATNALVAARFLLQPFADRLCAMARVHPPDTYTLNYMEGRLDPPPPSPTVGMDD